MIEVASGMACVRELVAKRAGGVGLALRGVALALALCRSGRAQGPDLSGAPLANVPAVQQAKQALRNGQWTEAEPWLRAELAAHGESAEPLYLLGYTLFHEDKPKESLQTYTRAARYATPSAEDLHTVALDYVLLGDFTDADRWITRAAAEDRENGEIWYAMGRIKYTENRFGEALSSFERAGALMPHSVKVATNLGLAYEGLNQPEAAIKAYRQAIAWQAGSPHPSEQPLLDLGVLLSDRNVLEEAESLLLAAEQIAPASEPVHAALGKLYTRRQQYPQAQRELQEALAAKPGEAGLHFQLGQVYRKEGNQVQARAELARAAALEGTHSSP